MAKIEVKTYIRSHLEIQPKVWFTCHPDDFDKCFDSVCDDILNDRLCVLYYTRDMTEILSEEEQEIDLGQCNLVVVPVTYRLLSDTSRAMDLDLRYAFRNHIPVLPIMMEPGLDALYSLPDKFGQLQYLDRFSTDETAIPYADKLKKHLDGVLPVHKMKDMVPGAFRAHIFLSYRKANRNLANSLMRLIHSHRQFRDVAIWYDEYLPLGEEFRTNIEKSLKSSDLFMLLVAQKLLEDSNFVMTVEYPAAKKEGIALLPVQMETVDPAELAKKFPGIPDSVNPNENIFADTLRDLLPAGKDTDQSSERTFLLGLSYLHGTYTEMNRTLGMEMISAAAESGYPDAAYELASIYYYGNGVDVDYQKAIKWFQKSAQGFAREYGNDHMLTRAALDGLAVAYSISGEHRKALELLEKLYQMNLQTYGDDDALTCLSLDHLASSYFRHCDYQKALECHLIVYRMREKNLEQYHPATLDTLERIAKDYHVLGDRKKALALQVKAYQLRKEAYSNSSIDALESMRTIGEYLDSLSDYSNALKVKKNIAALYQHIYGEDNQRTLDAKLNMADTYSKMGMYRQALALEEEVYTNRLRVYGKEHPFTLEVINMLAVEHNNLGNFRQAKDYSQYVYIMYRKYYGATHPNTMTMLTNLAIAYHSLRQDREALKLWKQIYRNYCATFGPNHTHAIGSLGNLALSYGDIGNHKKSQILLERAYRLSSRVNGEKHHDTYRIMMNLAGAYGRNGYLLKGLDMQEQAYALGCELLGKKHPDTLSAQFNLALMYNQAGAYQKAYDAISKAYSFQVETMGEEHPFTKRIRDNLMIISGNLQNHHKEAQDHGYRQKIRCQELRTQAENYRNVGNYRKALQVTLTLHNELCQSAGEAGTEMLQVLHDLSVIHQELEDDRSALETAEKGYALSCNLPGNAASYTRIFAKILISLYRKQGDYRKAKDLQKAIRHEQGNGSWFSRLKPKNQPPHM